MERWDTILPSRKSCTVGNFSGSRFDLCLVRVIALPCILNLTAAKSRIEYLCGEKSREALLNSTSSLFLNYAKEKESSMKGTEKDDMIE
jgi:hypothetical protein